MKNTELQIQSFHAYANKYKNKSTEYKEHVHILVKRIIYIYIYKVDKLVNS